MVRLQARTKDFYLLQRVPVRPWGPLSLLLNGNWCSVPGVKRPGREAEHSPPPTVEIKVANISRYAHYLMKSALTKQIIREHVR